MFWLEIINFFLKVELKIQFHIYCKHFLFFKNNFLAIIVKSVKHVILILWTEKWNNLIQYIHIIYPVYLNYTNIVILLCNLLINVFFFRNISWEFMYINNFIIYLWITLSRTLKLNLSDNIYFKTLENNFLEIDFKST